MASTRRGTNGARQDSGPDKESPFINLPWGESQDKAFDAWRKANPKLGETVMLDELFKAGLAVKLGQMNGSVFVTIESAAARQQGLKPLLSGWSDDWHDALFVAFFKWDQLLLRDFSHPTLEATRSRRR